VVERSRSENLCLCVVPPLISTSKCASDMVACHYLHRVRCTGTNQGGRLPHYRESLHCPEHYHPRHYTRGRLLAVLPQLAAAMGCFQRIYEYMVSEPVKNNRIGNTNPSFTSNKPSRILPSPWIA
jgi:hypothetical protein